MPQAPEDPAIAAVAAAIVGLDPSGQAWGAVIRHTFDMIYNGQDTGRYRWDQLLKTEKTHFGSLFEINAQRRFEFDGGDQLDFRIADHEVDAKWSQSFGRWMLPPEVFGEVALVGTADDQRAVWSLGLVRVTVKHRSVSTNRDKKSSLNDAGRRAIRWLWRDAPLPPNVLLQLEPTVVREIFAGKSGTERLNRLFRAADGRLVHRTTVATVAQQLDSQKRLRGNGGSRSALAAEGILILSGLYHAHFARDLGLPVPSKDEYISVRVVPADHENGALIAGQRWRRARPGDPIAPAPKLS